MARPPPPTRFDWLYSAEELAEWVEPLARLADEAEEVYALFNNNRDDFAPRSAQILRGLLDEAGVPASGRDRAGARRATAVLAPAGRGKPRPYNRPVRVLSIVHDPAETGGGGLFEKVVVERGDALDRWIVADGESRAGRAERPGTR